MGLLSKLKNTTGKLKDRVKSSIGALKSAGASVASRSSSIRFLGSAARVAGKVGKFAFKRTPVGTALTVGTLAYAGARKLFGKKKDQLQVMPAQAQTAGAQKKMPLAKKIALGLAGAGALAGVAYGAEQLAEKIGIRGGAGFIGRRKRKSTRRTSRRRTSRRSGKRVSFTTKDGRRVSFTPKRRSKFVTFRARRNRYGKGKLTMREITRIAKMIRRDERD